LVLVANGSLVGTGEEVALAAQALSALGLYATDSSFGTEGEAILSAIIGITTQSEVTGGGGTNAAITTEVLSAATELIDLALRYISTPQLEARLEVLETLSQYAGVSLEARVLVQIAAARIRGSR